MEAKDSLFFLILVLFQYQVWWLRFKGLLEHQPSLLYTRDGIEKITDNYISRGWQAKEVLLIGYGATENLVMRTWGFCFFIKIE